MSRESVKVFTRGCSTWQVRRQPPVRHASDLALESIDNSFQRPPSSPLEYWTTAAVPAMGLRGSETPWREYTGQRRERTAPHDWGWEYITVQRRGDIIYRGEGSGGRPVLMDEMASGSGRAAGFSSGFRLQKLTGRRTTARSRGDRLNTSSADQHPIGRLASNYFGAHMENLSLSSCLATARCCGGFARPCFV